MTDQLRAAAQAILDRWDSPKWEWATQGPTADLMAELRAALAQQDEPVAWVGDPSTQDYASTQPEPDAYGYASRLAVALWEKHYKDAAPQWKPLDDLMGVLTQIDNMTSGLTLLAQQAEPVEPVAWKQGNLVTFNEDPYPALGGLFVQFWDGEEVAARVYANDLETLRQRCAKVNTAPPQRKLVPLTEAEIEHIGITHQSLRQVARAVERAVWEKNNG